MRALRWAGSVAVVLALAGCGSDKAAVMPDVTGKKLDVAKSDIKDAGFEDDVKVDGGGLFGVIEESNWEVCDQSPSAGQAMTDPPRLTVDRSCGEDTTDESSTTPSEPPTKSPDPEQVLTAENNKDFAALLALTDDCGPSIKAFATKYSGRTIEFDGSIADMMNHGDYDTRFDILLAAGPKGPTYAPAGPNFKFEDVNVGDLNLTGTHIPNFIGEGDRFHFVAEVDHYSPRSCLFFLDPVSTKVR